MSKSCTHDVCGGGGVLKYPYTSMDRNQDIRAYIVLNYHHFFTINLIGYTGIVLKYHHFF
jgi:hypothetical protein